MGSEQSQLQQQAGEAGSSSIRGGSLRAQSSNATPTPSRSAAASGSKLLRGNTIAVAEISALSLDDGGPSSTGTPSSAYICDSRPVSPPMSVCSDSDLPYISYTDKPIGDSPKLRNKQQAKAGKIRPSSVIVGRSQEAMRSGSGGTAAMLIGRQRPYTGNTSSSSGVGGGVGTGTSNTVSGAAASSRHAHNIVVVKAAAVKETGIEKDDDIVRLQITLPPVGRTARDTVGHDGFRFDVLLTRTLLHKLPVIFVCIIQQRVHWQTSKRSNTSASGGTIAQIK
ncbi:hypothetical protein RP20_CCG020790 [Aedes albopictus]|nr:hypothetical protein RP20_CCG020790 [Aedes albopictus]